jgi:hypothetical protein
MDGTMQSLWALGLKFEAFITMQELRKAYTECLEVLRIACQSVSTFEKHALHD